MNEFNKRLNLGEGYNKHSVFPLLDSTAKFYDSLAFHLFSFITIGIDRVVLNLDAKFLDATYGNIQSIRQILLMGRINDAYALLRKFHDTSIMHIYANLYLSDHQSIENWTIKKVNDWVLGKAQLPNHREMNSYIRNSDKLSALNTLLFKTDERYKEVRDRCNDHLHFNYFKNMQLNDNRRPNANRLHALDQFSNDFRQILILHLSYAFFLNEHFMMSTDYGDYMDCGETPPEGCANWVAPYIQDVFDEIIKTERVDIADFLKANSAMDLA